MASMEVSVADELRQLMAKKDAMEKEIKELMTVLESQEGIGMSGPLVDKDQFPRADIDVYSVRHCRQRIICLQNDLKIVMGQIETGLHALHSDARTDTVHRMDVDSTATGQRPQKQPFARVALVDTGSPASNAGLQVGDELLEFGSVTQENFTSLQDIAAVVKHSNGHAVTLVVLREVKTKRLSLTPQTWRGPGLLGCKIVPIS
ncbi:26S proteasome non-ATPase regulatory subunit 9 [Lamellibrachia satsuma]|nr:26S proteasome non-ATPase regulatory subunit 9 [Lamellibrachia satsuma]